MLQHLRVRQSLGAAGSPLVSNEVVHGWDPNPNPLDVHGNRIRKRVVEPESRRGCNDVYSTGSNPAPAFSGDGMTQMSKSIVARGYP